MEIKNLIKKISHKEDKEFKIPLDKITNLLGLISYIYKIKLSSLDESLLINLSKIKSHK
jgi:hypothetical protein